MLPPKEQMEQFKAQQKGRFVDGNEQRPMPDPMFGEPDFGDEELESEHVAAPAPEEMRDDRYDVPEFSRPVTKSEGPPPTESLKSEGNAFSQDELLFEGGPTRTELMSWKKQFEIEGHAVNLSEIGEDVFIWRTLNRVEYREIMAIPNTDPLQREEIICEVCVLFPYNYNFKSMAEQKAGTPAILAEQIMKESGFSKIAPPIRL